MPTRTDTLSINPNSPLPANEAKLNKHCIHRGVILTQHHNFARSPKSQPAELTISPKRPTPTKHDNPNRQSMARNQPQNSPRQADLSPARLHRTQQQHGLAPVRNCRLENLHPRNRKPTTQTVKTLFKNMTTRRPNARTHSTPPKENFK